MLAQASVMIMGIVDTAIVGRCDELELAAVSLGNAVAFGILAFGSGFSLALEPLISQAVGAKDPQRAWGWWQIGVRVAVLSGLALSGIAIGVVMITPALGVETATAERAMTYLLARTPSTILYLVYLAARSVLQSYGRTRSLLVAALVANVVNVVTDMILVLGDRGLAAMGLPEIGFEGLGALGAGLTTSLSTMVMVAWMWRDLMRFRPTTPHVTPLQARRADRRTLLTMGWPIGVQTAAEFLIFSTVGVLAARFGDAAVGAHQIALHVSTLTFMAAIGLGGAVSARVGHAIGRGAPQEVGRAGLAAGAIGMCLSTVAAVVFATVPMALVSVFAPDKPAVLAIASELMLVAAAFQLVDGLQVVMAGALRGAGDIQWPFRLTLVSYWLLGFPSALLFAYTLDLGVNGLWYGLTIGLAAAAGSLTWRFVVVSRRAQLRVE